MRYVSDPAAIIGCMSVRLGWNVCGDDLINVSGLIDLPIQ